MVFHFCLGLASDHDLPTYAFQGAWITGMNYYAWFID
jgi:hypothetical protein